jgi:hypothetical protein
VPALGCHVHVVLISFCPRGSGGGGSAAGENGGSRSGHRWTCLDHFRGTNILHSTSRSTHLPSPIFPTIQPTPVFCPVASHLTQPVVCPQLQRYDIALIKDFAHEVLRCSRTSGTILQTALCHLEAIRSRVPDLVRKEEHIFLSSSVASDVNDGRISQDEVSIDYNTDLDSPAFSTETSSSDSLLATVHINPISYEFGASFSMEPSLSRPPFFVPGWGF